MLNRHNFFDLFGGDRRQICSALFLEAWRLLQDSASEDYDRAVTVRSKGDAEQKCAAAQCLLQKLNASFEASEFDTLNAFLRALHAMHSQNRYVSLPNSYAFITKGLHEIIVFSDSPCVQLSGA
jgi:hypothetical protein